MAVTQVKNGFAGWRKYRPPSLKQLPFNDLQPSTVLGDSYIQGMVVTKWPVKKYKNSHLLKVIIQEVLNDHDDPKLGSQKLQIFIIGSIVQKWDKVISGDYVCLSNMLVEGAAKDTLRVVVEENDQRVPCVWVIKKAVTPSLTTQNISAAALATRRPTLKQSYAYTLLKDIKPSTTVNVWGVIKFHKPPSKSRGLDYVQTISIVDASLTGADEKVVCQVFAPRPDKLPNAVNAGQIIRLHRLRIGTFNGKTQGSSGPGWSWLLFDSKTLSSTQPIAHSSVTYSFSDADADKVVELRQWLMSDQCPVHLPENTSAPDHNSGEGPTEAGDGALDVPTPAAASLRDPVRSARSLPATAILPAPVRSARALPSAPAPAAAILPVPVRSARALSSAPAPSAAILPVPVRSARALPSAPAPAAVILPVPVRSARALPATVSDSSTAVPVTPRIGSAHHQSIVAKQLESLRTSANTQKQQYHGFTSIQDLKPKTTVNVMGVIEFVKPIHRTVKREYLKVVTIVDQTSETKLKCLLFTNQLSILPESTFVGQIICFHRLNVSAYNGEWQGLRGPGFAWTLFDSQAGAAAEEVASSKDNRSLVTIDKDKVFELQEWAENRGILRYQRNKRISAIQPGEYFDLVCQVVGVRVEDPLTCMLLRVWDGTEPMIPLYQVSTSGNSLQTNRTLEEQSYGMAVDVFVYDDHFRTAACLKAGDYVALSNLHAMRSRNVEAADIEAAVPRVELCLHHGTTYSRGLHLIDPNTDLLAATVKEQLLDIAPSPSTGFTEPRGVNMLTRKRTRSSIPSITLNKEGDNSLSSDHSPRQKTRRLEEPSSPNLTRRSSRRLSGQSLSPKRMSNGEGGNKENVKGTPSSSSANEKPRCLQQSATVLTGHHHMKTTLLAEVIEHPSPYKFRVRVQLVDFQPKESDKLYKLHCPSCHHIQDSQTSGRQRRRSQRLEDPQTCPNCSDKLSGTTSTMNDTLVLELLVADRTGWLRAHLWGDEAETFFADIVSPSSPSAFTEISAGLSQLCPPPSVDAGHYRRPWMECCVASYRASGETCFHIFDTMIAVNDE